MRPECECAANFVTDFVGSEDMTRDRLLAFSTKLREQLEEAFRNHWHPENPKKGCAFRCLRSNHQPDPYIQKAADLAGLDAKHLHRLPKELTIWVDPREVSYRIGEDGSICTLLSRPAPPPASTPVSPNAESWYPSSSPRSRASPPLESPQMSPRSSPRTSPPPQMMAPPPANLSSTNSNSLYQGTRNSPVNMIYERRASQPRIQQYPSSNGHPARIPLNAWDDIPNVGVSNAHTLPMHNNYTYYSGPKPQYRQQQSAPAPGMTMRSSPPRRSPSPPYRSSRLNNYVRLVPAHPVMA